MNSVKNKTVVVGEKKKPIQKNSARSFKEVSKKTKATWHNVQLAFTEEFFLLKDISGNNNENLAALLGTTTRTIQNKKNNVEPFDIAQTERLRKLIQLFKEGSEIFGNKEEFNKWLRLPSYGLDYFIPSELLKQPGGLGKVFTELNSIKFGDTI